jgi:plastocyanin
MPVRAPWRLLSLVAAVLIGGGCNAAMTATNVAAPRSGGPAQQFDVHLDAPAGAAVPAVFPAYLPSQLVAHAGDRIVFHASAQGQPHTVTFGAAVNAALAPLDHAAQVGTAPLQPERGALAALPHLLAGGRVTQTLARPCALGSTLNDACVAPDHPFRGGEALFGSGLLAPGTDFTVTLDRNIPAGTYRFFCAVMRSAMTGSITVVDDSVPVPAPSAVEQEAQAQLQTRADILSSSLPHSPGTHVVGGVSVPGVGIATVFRPRQVHIPVGGAVTWTLTGATVSFDVPESLWLTQFETRSDGAVDVNRAPLSVIGASTATWDGRSPRSSGAPTASFPPATSTYTLRFLTAGTYAYQCLLHADMSGLVTVG